MSNIKGVSSAEVRELQEKYGRNTIRPASEYRILRIIRDIIREPMFILLIIACSLYFILGSNSEGIMMAFAMAIVTAISLYQEVKSKGAIKALNQLTEPRVKVIRDGEESVISTEDLVPGDVILLEEGARVPADARIVQSNDLSVNEAVISGESLPVDKNESEGNNNLYQGATINSGKCLAVVIATGNNTTLGKIGKAISGYNLPKTLLQVQVNRFVRKLALFGLIAFLVIFVINYLHYGVFVTSLLFALTLAMSAVPEEIPVAFSSFMALGAYKLSKLGIISRQPQIIENLGAINVLCLDKTGTITENKMEVVQVYDHNNDSVTDLKEAAGKKDAGLLWYATLASESDPFDAMEKAIVEAHESKNQGKIERLQMIHEYPLEGRPPMMTHVYTRHNNFIAAAKGSAEKIIEVCKLNDAEKKKVTDHIQKMAARGYRVLGVASATLPGSVDFPVSQEDFNWQFEGLVALYDPPKKNIPEVLRNIYAAGINIKLVTGDHPVTAITIAAQVGIPASLRYYTGEEVMKMNKDELAEVAKQVTVFARMFPEAKLKLIRTIQANGDIVAMTGDGVNDGPALKAADIGIAMGKKGTDTARQASDLVLTDDNLEKIIIAVSEGRKIYNNLIKAIRYIISIHIPIILTASLPLIMGWKYPNIFTPIHVIFLELIMGPTCSIFFEREPVEGKNMLKAPRDRNAGLFTKEELWISIVQGFVITAVVLLLYYIFMNNGHTIGETRNIVFTTLILSNLFLTFVNRSSTRSLFYTSRYKNRLAPVIVAVSALFLVLLHFVPAIRNLFGLSPISLGEFGLCFAGAFASVMWFEVYKMDLKK